MARRGEQYDARALALVSTSRWRRPGSARFWGAPAGMGYARGRAMLRRLSLSLVLSVLAHVGMVGLGLALGARGWGGPVDIELADVHVAELKDFPLGGPEDGTHAKPKARARARSHAPAAPEAGTLAARAGDEKPQAGS